MNLVVGINGTGKSTWLKSNVVERQQKVLVLTPDDSEWRMLPTIRTPQEARQLQGRARLVYNDVGTIEMIKDNYYGEVLIMDDAMAYLRNQTDDTMRYLYIRRRQRGLDVYLVAHGLRQLPPQCFTFGSFLILFASTENFADRKRELQPATFDRIVVAQSRLNLLCDKGNPYEYEIIKLDPSISK